MVRTVEATQDYDHCWHLFAGPIWMVLADGMIVQKCCHCPATRTIHRDHSRHRLVKK